MKASWHNTLSAQGEAIAEVECNARLPHASPGRRHVVGSSENRACPGQLDASNTSLRFGERNDSDAAAFCPQPKPRAESAAGRVALWRGAPVQA